MKAVPAKPIARVVTDPKVNVPRAGAIKPGPKVDRNAGHGQAQVPADLRADLSNAAHVQRADPADLNKAGGSSSRRSSQRSTRTTTANYPPTRSPTLPWR